MKEDIACGISIATGISNLSSYLLDCTNLGMLDNLISPSEFHVLFRRGLIIVITISQGHGKGKNEVIYENSLISSK